ncbi:hypothetical protein TraAM80_03450 [Trypanosoma rangeli]|uniref:Uncharacterized protein n=1 Tax=Trypanosoma rangeli TaxID=5698 RepID=A0A422NPC4_TRYRA|nr:uncharacterized protein TraAM80_03450 [Trypanosoma rangeli]RNF07315.1 hypothetical protein TraAM80_03450 [Trypanosoma rangeli]|eukprot:RNF07315.1 hypothetical protein TraAM80_03450 [Trypanosoma rangeli]
MAFDMQQKVFRIPSNIAVSTGLRWDFIGADPVDLDLSAVCFTSEGMFLDCVFFNHPFPADTDEDALRSSGVLVDPQQLPYMFVSGDSRIGGEEENQLPGLALAAKRREYQLRSSSTDSKKNEVQRMGIMDELFSRLYEEAELDEVEEVLGEDHRASRRRKRREFCDESVTFVMHKIPSEVSVIFLVVTSYTGADFTTLPGVKLEVVNETTNERVGEIDLKHSTGDGTASLACMLCRLPLLTDNPAEPQLWDLRELNVRTFGYTFVDVLPVMLDVLNVEHNSRGDAVKRLPDYPLTKDDFQHTEQPLSDVRFGVGWYGEHDLDAFMVMLDENNDYLDHLHPKQAKLHSVHPHVARHSGDSLNGFGTTGDEEFIDLMMYRMPSEVHTILFGATYVESFGRSAGALKSIFDVPKLYLRLQNRTAERPNSSEVDRWNIHYEAEEEHAWKKGQKANKGEEGPRGSICRTYTGPDGKMYPVRMVLLGAMIKKGEVPFYAMYPRGRLDQQQFQQNHADHHGLSEPEENVPLFEYLPLHEYTPVSTVDFFSSLMPFLYGIARYRCNTGGSGTMLGGAMHPPHAPSVMDEVTSWHFASFPARSSPLLWEEMKASGSILTYYGLQLQFVEVRNLRPALPHRFKCHGEAWVCGGMPSGKRPITPHESPPFRTPYLIHRDKTRWNEKSPATSALFFVRKFDRIRVLVYEYATLGSVELDLLQFDELWRPTPQPTSQGFKGAFNCVEQWFPLTGGSLTDGEIRLRLFRVPDKVVLEVRKRMSAEANKRRRRLVQQRAERREDAARKRYATACHIM